MPFFYPRKPQPSRACAYCSRYSGWPVVRRGVLRLAEPKKAPHPVQVFSGFRPFWRAGDGSDLSRAGVCPKLDAPAFAPPFRGANAKTNLNISQHASRRDRRRNVRFCQVLNPTHGPNLDHTGSEVRGWNVSIWQRSTPTFPNIAGWRDGKVTVWSQPLRPDAGRCGPPRWQGGVSMSNPSRIAMLAQLREATGDDIRAADRARDESKDGSTVWQEQMLQRACRADETLTCLILGQKPTTERDMLSLMVAITGATDLLLDTAAGEPNAAELQRLTELVELVEQAAGNAALYLCQSAEPYTPQEQRAVRSLRARFDMSDASTGEEA